MWPTAPFYEVAIIKFLEINERFAKKQLTCEEAAEILGISISTFYRKRMHYSEDGLAGLVDQRIGKASSKRVPADKAIEIINLFETQYYDFTVKHFHVKLVERGCSYSYTWVKNTLQEAGVVKKAKNAANIGVKGQDVRSQA